MPEQTLNIPQLIAVLLITFFALRWFFFSSSSPSSSSSARSSRHDRVNPAHVEQLAQMFPQLERREIAWDLQRNRGNMAMTTERVLSGRVLESPPQSFQPPPSILNPNANANANSSSASSPSTSVSVSSMNSSYQNLITRYNLSSKLGSSRGTAVSSRSNEQAGDGYGSSISSSKGGSASPAGKTWSSNRTERQRLLQERREQMILEARRKMLEKERGR